MIKTQVTIGSAKKLRGPHVADGEILNGSSIGETPFCPGGTFQDAHTEDPAIGFLDRTVKCSDGTVRIGFAPQQPTSPLTQSGPWHVVSGTGAYEDLMAEGEMRIRYEPHTQGTEGQETFSGTAQP